MPALIPECVKRVEDEGERVTLVNPSGGAEVKMNAWEARLLPFLDSADDARTIVRNAHATGVTMPLDHVEALLKRLRTAGLLVEIAPAPPPPAPSAPDAAPTLIGAFQPEDTDEPMEPELPLPPAPHVPDEDAWIKAPPPEPEPRPAPAPRAPIEPPPLPRPPRAPAPPAAPVAAPPAVPLVASPAAFRPLQPQPTKRKRQPSFEPLRARPRGSGRLRLAGIGLGVVVGALALIPSPFGVVAPCLLQPVVRQQVRLPVGATIHTVLVEEGQPVKAGDVLAVLDSERLRSDLHASDATVMVLEGAVKRLTLAGRPDVSKLRELVDLRSAEMRIAYLEFRRFEALARIGQATAAQIEKATAAIAVTKAALIEAQAELADAMSHKPEDIHLKEGELERLRTTRARQTQLADQPEIRSPIDGTIATPEMNRRVGHTFAAGAELLEIVQLEHLRAEARLPPRYLGTVQVGAQVQVAVTGFAERFPSRLQRVGTGIEGESDAPFVRLVAVIDNPRLQLRQNAQCVLEVETDRDSILRALLRRAGW